MEGKAHNQAWMLQRKESTTIKLCCSTHWLFIMLMSLIQLIKKVPTNIVYCIKVYSRKSERMIQFFDY